MTASWQSPVLSTVPGGARPLAELVAAELGTATSTVVEVVRLHLEALDTGLALEVPELLADQIRWQALRLEGAGAPFGTDEVSAALRVALARHLGAASLARIDQLQRAAAVLAASGQLTDVLVPLEDSRSRDYLTAALDGRRDDAIAVVRGALLDGARPAAIMLEILQPAQVELGRLWELGEISIAHEHYTTAITQLSLSLLHPRMLLERTLLGRSVVATTIGAEAHEIGIRMISDLLEQEGWRTTYLGADVPLQDIVETVAQQRADVLALSATMAGHLRGVQELVSAVRADPRCERVRVIVGGRPFAINPGLASVIGADGWAPGALEALDLVRDWTEDRAHAD